MEEDNDGNLVVRVHLEEEAALVQHLAGDVQLGKRQGTNRLRLPVDRQHEVGVQLPDVEVAADVAVLVDVLRRALVEHGVQRLEGVALVLVLGSDLLPLLRLHSLRLHGNLNKLAPVECAREFLPAHNKRALDARISGRLLLLLALDL